MFENVKLEGTESSPAVTFDYDGKRFQLVGASYMEDVAGFYSGFLEQLKSFLETLQREKVVFILELSYFNSSSARVIFKLFEWLDEAAGNGNQVTIEWHCDDEDIAEEGTEMAEDLTNATFLVVEKS